MGRNPVTAHPTSAPKSQPGSCTWSQQPHSLQWVPSAPSKPSHVLRAVPEVRAAHKHLRCSRTHPCSDPGREGQGWAQVLQCLSQLPKQMNRKAEYGQSKTPAHMWALKCIPCTVTSNSCATLQSQGAAAIQVGWMKLKWKHILLLLKELISSMQGVWFISERQELCHENCWKSFSWGASTVTDCPYAPRPAPKQGTKATTHLFTASTITMHAQCTGHTEL